MGKSTCQRNGVVLIVVLVLVLLMSVAAYGFLLSMQTENIAARTGGDRLTAQQAAFSGIELLSALLEMPRAERHELGGVVNNPELFRNVALDDQLEVLEDEMPRFMVLAPDSGDFRHAPRVYGAADESAKLHLGQLLRWDQSESGLGKEALMRLPGMTPDVADAILDWVDADSQPRMEGAERETYAGLGLSVAPRNGQPLHLRELLLVRGVEENRLLGHSGGAPIGFMKGSPAQSFRPHSDSINISSTSNFTLRPGNDQRTGHRTSSDDASSPLAARFSTAKDGWHGAMKGSDEQLSRPWTEFLTVHSGHRNESSEGDPRIFLNQPRLDRLHQQLVEQLPVSWANFIVLYRQYGPGGSDERTETADQVTIDLTVPPTRTIASPLDLIDVTVSAPREGDDRNVTSPFSSDPQFMQSQLPRFLDKVSVTAATKVVGRVNINRASREVLLAVPGIDAALAERILGARAMGRDNDLQRNHPVWLLAEGLVDLPTMRRLLPNVNAGGDVFRAEFVGYSHRDAATYRCEAIIDATNGQARQIDFCELPPP